MKRYLKAALSVAAVILLIAVAVFAYNALSKEVKPDSGAQLPLEQNDESDKGADKEKAPDFTVVDLDGKNVKLSDMIGSPVVLNFWASWCPPCKSEMPEFEAVYKELGGDVQFMMVDMTDGVQETKEMGAKYVQEQGFTFPVFFDTEYEGALMYGIRAIPTTFFIDREGYIITSAQGAMDERSLRNGIAMITK